MVDKTYEVKAPKYFPDGKIKIGKKTVDSFRVEFEKIGEADSMEEAKQKYGHICKHPALSFANNEKGRAAKISSEQDFGY